MKDLNVKRHQKRHNVDKHKFRFEIYPHLEGSDGIAFEIYPNDYNAAFVCI